MNRSSTKADLPSLDLLDVASSQGVDLEVLGFENQSKRNNSMINSASRLEKLADSPIDRQRERERDYSKGDRHGHNTEFVNFFVSFNVPTLAGYMRHYLQHEQICSLAMGPPYLGCTHGLARDASC